MHVYPLDTSETGIYQFYINGENTAYNYSTFSPQITIKIVEPIVLDFDALITTENFTVPNSNIESILGLFEEANSNDNQYIELNFE